MKLTRQRKILLGVVAVGLGGLLIDRATSAPTAESETAASAAIVRPAAAAPASPAAAAKTNLLGQRLLALGRSERLDGSAARDAFSPSPAWSGDRGDFAASSADQFRQSHRLSGVVLGRSPSAFVDGKLVVVGETVDGFKLVSVGSGHAVFDSPAGRAVLSINQ